MATAGQGSGVGCSFDRISIRPNTVNAHRPIHATQRGGEAGVLVERLFTGYFQRGENLAYKGVLTYIAAQWGGNETAALAYLDGDEDRVEVVARAASMRRQCGGDAVRGDDGGG